MDDLKRVEKPEERPEPTSKKEAGKETPEETKAPTLRTYSEEEFQKAQSSWGSQVTLSKAEATKANAEAEEAKVASKGLETRLQSLQSEHDELMEKQFSDDPDALKGYRDKKAIADDRLKVVQEKADVERKRYEAEKMVWAANMSKKALELSKESGIDTKDLESCQTEEGMEVKSLKFQMAKLAEAKKEETETPQKFDSVVPTGGGGSLTVEQVRKMSPEERAERSSEIAKIPLGLGLKIK